MGDLDERVEQFCTAPGGCAFLLVVEASALPPEIAAQPDVAVYAAAIAQWEIRVWNSDHDAVVPRILAEGPRLRHLARSILAQSETAWWWAPVDRTAQIWISPDGSSLDAPRIVTPTEPTTKWERYAQKPKGGLFTSTAIDGTSSVLATLWNGTGDYPADVQEPPLTWYRLEAASDARVFEVDSPEAWHQFCLRYPVEYEGALAGSHWDEHEGGRIVPDWAKVAQDWDGMHLTLGGLLTAEQVRVESTPGWTRHWGWDFEQTVWLRWCFDEVTCLPDLPQLPDPPVQLRFPWKFIGSGWVDSAAES